MWQSLATYFTCLPLVSLKFGCSLIDLKNLWYFTRNLFRIPPLQLQTIHLNESHSWQRHIFPFHEIPVIVHLLERFFFSIRVKLPQTPINCHQGLKSRNLKHPLVKLAWYRKPSNQSGIDKVTTLVSLTVQHMEISPSFITDCSNTFFFYLKQTTSASTL